MNDFHDWKQHPITQEVFGELKARMNILVEELIEQTPYASQSEMAEKAGAIKAIRDLLSIELGEDSDGR